VATRHTSISATIIFDARLPASVPSIIPALKVIANVVAIALGADHLGISLTGLRGKHNIYWPYSLSSHGVRAVVHYSKLGCAISGLVQNR
jgi:hypothetical protein